MLKLKEIIRQLSPENYGSLVKELGDSKAEKFQKLLIFYREESEPDERIIESLDLNVNAFYTLKSRLFDKIQQKLTKELGKGSDNLIRQVAEIPGLLYETPRAVAIAALKKLEKDLLDNHLHNELIPVYAALKKLHYNTPKYYTYSQAYNRHIAYTLALGKASDLLSDFNRVLAEYEVAKTPLLLAQLSLIKKEIHNLFQLNQSHQLYLHQAIVDISMAVFVDDKSLSADDEPVEDILKKCEEIFNSYTQEKAYPYFMNIIDFLAFSYYNKLGLDKMAARFLERFSGDIKSFLEYDHSAFTAILPVQLIEWRLGRNEDALLDEDFQNLPSIEDDMLSVPQKILIGRARSAYLFSRKEFEKAAQELNALVNLVSFKHFTHAEFEIKCFLALNHAIAGKDDPALILMRSVSRKVREAGMQEYEQVKVWVKLINAILKKSSDHDKKCRVLLDQFDRENMPQRLEFGLSPERILSRLVRR